MTDILIQFSETIPDITAEERAWIEQTLALKAQGARIAGDPAGDIGFLWSFETTADDVPYLNIFSDQEFGGRIETVADFIQEFLRKWRPDGFFTMGYAQLSITPSLPSGGGVLWASATQRYIFDTGNFLETLGHLCQTLRTCQTWLESGADPEDKGRVNLLISQALDKLPSLDLIEE